MRKWTILGLLALFAASVAGIMISDTVAIACVQHRICPVLQRQAAYSLTNDPRGSAFSTLEFETRATRLKIFSYNDLWKDYPQFTELGVTVDGRWWRITPHSSGVTTHVVAGLPAGLKHITIVAGLQSRPKRTILGTWPIRVDADAPLLRIEQHKSRRWVFLCDSIGVGGNAQSPVMQSAVMAVRAAAPADTEVDVEGFGWASWWDYAQDSGARAKTASILTGANLIYTQLGTNDYGLKRWTPSAMAHAVGALVDMVHAKNPGAPFIVQTPLPRKNEAKKKLGYSLPRYREALASLQQGRPWLRIVDGTRMGITVADLDDGVHPTTATQALWGKKIKAILGLP